MNRWVESFTILAKHGLGNWISAEHDIVYTHCEEPSDESKDGKRLLELGWHRDDGQWAHFT